MRYINIKKIFVVLVVIFMLFETRADDIMTNDYVGFIDGLAYYFDKNCMPIRSGEFDGLKRINDTNFFVNNDGLIFDRVDFKYEAAKEELLRPLYGKELTYDNIKLYMAKNSNTPLDKYKYKVEDGGKNVSIFKLNYNIDSSIYTYKDRNGISLCVIGDSYTTNFAIYTKCDFSYITHPGYSVQYIRAELLNLINDFADIKYFFVFIGPNDLMIGRSPFEFENDLRYIINYIKSRGHEVILTSYLGTPFRFYKYNVSEYDIAIFKLSREFNCEYIECKDLDALYERLETDQIHPPKGFYIDLYDRVVSYIVSNWSSSNVKKD